MYCSWASSGRTGIAASNVRAAVAVSPGAARISPNRSSQAANKGAIGVVREGAGIGVENVGGVSSETDSLVGVGLGLGATDPCLGPSGIDQKNKAATARIAKRSAPPARKRIFLFMVPAPRGATLNHPNPPR